MLALLGVLCAHDMWDNSSSYPNRGGVSVRLQVCCTVQSDLVNQLSLLMVAAAEIKQTQHAGACMHHRELKSSSSQGMENPDSWIEFGAFGLCIESVRTAALLCPSLIACIVRTGSLAVVALSTGACSSYLSDTICLLSKLPFLIGMSKLIEWITFSIL